jgi:hypothetical protein
MLSKQMEVVGVVETSAMVYEISRCYTPESATPRGCRGDLTSQVLVVVVVVQV